MSRSQHGVDRRESARALDTPRASWTDSLPSLFASLGTSATGLSSIEAERRLHPTSVARHRRRGELARTRLLLRQLRSPVLLLLVVSAVLSLVVHETLDATIILVILAIGVALGFWQERRAAVELERLLALVHVRARVMRDGIGADVPLDEVVPGDVVILSAGLTIPGDARVIEATHLFADESTLTGESVPVEKLVAPPRAATDAADVTSATVRDGMLFFGSHVVSGSGTALVIGTGADTVLGEVSARVRAPPPVTEFERGIRHFGYLLVQVTGVIVTFIFAVNVYLHRPLFDSFLFALALAVGLTPQLLPAIVSVTLARGAHQMARVRVLVKRVSAIEDIGSIDVLCVDKTGTVTSGVLHIHSAVDASGQPSDAVLRFACINAALQAGYANPLDDVLRLQARPDVRGITKTAEIPYDFVRRRLSVVADVDGARTLVTKGALERVVSVCTRAARPGGATADIGAVRSEIDATFAALSAEGHRCLGVAMRVLPLEEAASDAERDMTFLGIVSFEDPLKPDAARELKELSLLGIHVKLITGDNHLVAAHVARQLGLAPDSIVSGDEVRSLSDDALSARAARAEVFADVDPVQKERIISSLRRGGAVVGFLGDGINDAPALHASDVGISVDSAADVAKQAADLVLLEKSLGVLIAGVREGRRAYANTLKYIFITTSANFGNMISMAAASLITPFLPLLPQQVLAINLLTDLPALALATDRVDRQLVAQPHRWSNRLIRNFMLSFGLLSSVFDVLTFVLLLWLLHAAIPQFRTGWFIESVLSEVCVLLVIRTRRPFFMSAPGVALLAASGAVLAITLVLPLTTAGAALGLAPISGRAMGAILIITAAYTLATEMTKRAFFRRGEA
jgi:Mg2+-importing ATPase